MKKVILLLMSLAIVSFANGQIVKIQGGPSVSKLTSVDNSLRMGHSIFVGVDYLDKPYFNLSSSIGLVRKGGKDKIPMRTAEGEPMGIYTNKTTLGYLSINTTFEFNIPKTAAEALRPFVSIGPRFDFLLRNNGFDTYMLINGEDFSSTLSDDLNSISAGLVFGGGVKYDISNFQFGLRIDYYLDFTKIFGDISSKAFTINLSVGRKL